MSNENQPVGLRLVEPKDARSFQVKVPAGYTGKDGDVVYMAAAGTLTNTVDAGLPVVGVQSGSIIDKDDLTTKTTAEADDYIHITDPEQIYKGQISTGALTDPYTTFTSGSCFDIAGSAGAQYINAAASTYDLIQILGPGTEEDGSFSALGAYMKVKCRFNPAKILPMTSTYNQLK